MTESNKVKYSFYKKALLFVLTVFVILLILEGTLRMIKKVDEIKYKDCLHPDEQTGMYEPDSKMGYILKPNLKICKYAKNGNKIYFYTNNIRSRNVENFSSEKPKNIKKRILLLGDSFVTGFYTDNNESYAAKLNEKLGTNYEVIAIGGSGYSTSREASILENITALNLKPDIVIVNIIENDYVYDSNLDTYSDNHERFLLRKIDKDGEERLIAFGNITRDDPDVSKNYEGSLTLSFNQLDNKRLMRVNIASFGENPENKAPLSKKSYLYSLIERKIKNSFNENEDYTKRTDLAIMYRYDSEEVNNSILLNLRLFDKIAFSGIKEDFKTVFVNIPDRQLLDEDYFKKANANINFPKDKEIDKDRINKLQEGFMNYRDYYYLDLTQFFMNKKDVYFSENDEHWNAKGNELASNILFEYLNANDLL